VRAAPAATRGRRPEASKAAAVGGGGLGRLRGGEESAGSGAGDVGSDGPRLGERGGGDVARTGWPGGAADVVRRGRTLSGGARWKTLGLDCNFGFRDAYLFIGRGR